MLPITAFVLSAFAFVPSLAASSSAVPEADHLEILKVHNKYRTRAGAPALVWNATLANFAESWVDKCINAHSNSPVYGENMGYGYNTWEAMIDTWADEFRDYKYGTEELQLQTLHFTEIVWKSTVSVGCARSSCDFNPRFYSCNYYPHGNTLTQFIANVQRLKN
ncbi:unnamed protein product [Umbelopsis ramanniana]